MVLFVSQNSNKEVTNRNTEPGLSMNLYSDFTTIYWCNDGKQRQV